VSFLLLLCGDRVVVSYGQNGEHDVASMLMQRTISSVGRVAADRHSKGVNKEIKPRM
jgi:hypothetical protein